MLALAFLLLAQEAPPDREVSKLITGLNGLFTDPFKNADELDRRYLGLSKVVQDHPEFKWRDKALAWMHETAFKTGRPAEALAACKERLKSKTLDAKTVNYLQYRAVYAAALALKTQEVFSLVKTYAQERPDSGLANMREEIERDAAFLGRTGASVSAPPYDGSRSVSWRTLTKDKFVFLYFTASW